MSRAPCSPSTEPPAPKGRKPRLRTSTRPNAKGALSASTAGSAPSIIWTEPVSRYSLLLTVVVLGFIARIELQHAAAVFVYGELGALKAAALTRSQLGRVNLITIGLIGKKTRRVHDAGIDVAARRLGGKTLGNRIERRQALEYATMTMRGQ